MNRFFSHRSKSTSVYKKFWRESSRKKKAKPCVSRYSFRNQFQKNTKKNKHIRSKSMFFQFSTPIEKVPSNFRSKELVLDYLYKEMSRQRKDYLIKFKAIRRKLIEFSNEMADELIFKNSSKVSKFPSSSVLKVKSKENVTSIGTNSMNLEDMIRELVMSSKIYLNENQILSIVRFDLSNLNLSGNNYPSEKQVLEMSLRGYLGIFNELLYQRHALIQRTEEALKVYINIMSHDTGDLKRSHKQIRDWVKVIKSENVEKLEKVIDWTEADTYERNTKLLEIYATEWQIIGKMKKELEKLVDNCRICEKKVKVHNLIEHSNYCEKSFQIRDEIKHKGREFVEKATKFHELISEEESGSNIGSIDKLISYDSPKNGKSMRTFGATKRSVFGQKSDDTRQKRQSMQIYNNSIGSKKFQLVPGSTNSNDQNFLSPKLLRPPGIPDFNLNSDSENYDGTVLAEDSLRSSKEMKTNRLFHKSINYQSPSGGNIEGQKKYSDTPKPSQEIFDYNVSCDVMSKEKTYSRDEEGKDASQCFLIQESREKNMSQGSNDVDYSGTILPIRKGSRRRIPRRRGSKARRKGENKKRLRSTCSRTIQRVAHSTRRTRPRRR